MIDDGLDTGGVLLQREVAFDESIETLSSSYASLQRRVQTLFLDNLRPLPPRALESLPRSA